MSVRKGCPDCTAELDNPDQFEFDEEESGTEYYLECPDCGYQGTYTVYSDGGETMERRE
jgi:DNA-directed RNA polymerase subunit RPC12/RpoP